MTNSLLYEDAHLQCIHQPGSRTDALIVTFGEMMMRPYPQPTIWAGEPIGKLDLPAIGFVGKRQNWYPEASVRSALNAAGPLLDSAERRIGYGFSMGAWAVLKYGRDFRLDVALSFSPQYSIDPDVIADRRFTQYFDPALNHGMEIAAGDGAALNILACDPHDAGDRESAERIMAVIDARLVRLDNLGHGSVKCVTRTKTLERIFDACLTGDAEAIAHSIRAARRFGEARPQTIANAIVARKPATAFAIYCKYRDLFPVAHRPAFLYKLRRSIFREACFEELTALSGTLGETPGFLAVRAEFLHDMGQSDEARQSILRAIAIRDLPSYQFLLRKFSEATDAVR
ncbi:hypothetical protein [Tropicibacter sp. S64]|uniref:hypothetical protein n=1 Tax=Tropicibacter sp. S64 TaxID=3415122 RepID=UPI003C7CE90E